MRPSKVQPLAVQTEIPAVEALEPRQLMSGNVLASVQGGTLVITGDTDANDVVVTVGSQPGQVVVGTGSNTTSINGGSKAAILASVSAIGANMGDGDDVLTISGLTLTGGVNIAMGGGGNVLTLGTSHITGSMTVSGGEGNETFTFDHTGFGSNVTVRAAGGHDVTTFNWCTVVGGLTIGSTDLNYLSSWVRGPMVMNAFQLDGNVTFTYDEFFGTVNIATGAGRDVVEIDTGCIFYGQTSILTQAGDDSVTINDIHFQADFLLDVGDGNDVIAVATTATTRFDGLTRLLGQGGNDSFVIGAPGGSSFGNFATDNTFFRGGAGPGDVLTYLANGNGFEAPPVVMGFETVN